MQALQAWLPSGWRTALQMGDPLTQTLQTVAGSVDVGPGELLALAPLPEAYSEPPGDWLLERLGWAQCHAFPLVSERPFGRLLLLADGSALRLDEHRAEQIRRLCVDAVAELERAQAHREDEKFSVRLRKITETELAIRFAEASLDLLPESRATAVLGFQGEALKVLDVRLPGGRRRERFLYHLLPLDETHLAALLRRSTAPGRGTSAVLPDESFLGFAEGRHLRALLEETGGGRVETVPLEAAGRLVGSLVVLHPLVGPTDQERAAIEHLARGLASSLDRIRPERRQASSLLYLQELLRTSRGGLVSILRTVVEEIVSFMDADAGLLALVDAETGTLLLSEHLGYTRGSKLPVSISLTEDGNISILGHVVRSGEPYVASDTRASTIYLSADTTIRSEIAVPLRLRGETVGVAMASSRAPDTFLAEDLTRFQLFADQVAVAVDNAKLIDELRRQREQQTLRGQQYRFGFHPSVHAEDVEYHFGNLVGSPHGAMGRVYRTIERVAVREQDIVLILGETGAGKEMVSHAIHNASPRRSKPLVATNFAALGGDPNLIQSELFGHEKGAFTGAVRRRKGCFEKAHGSTLLIDELGDIVPSVQVKLLRVLGRSSKRELQRLGGDEMLTADVRVLCATNVDLRAEMEAGRFREDLYYRLSALVVRIPPLRERPEDIPLLVRHMLPRLGGDHQPRIGRGVYQALASHPFPGNVRQLESVLLRALVMFGNPDELTSQDIDRALEIEDGDLYGGGKGKAVGRDRLECPVPAPEGWFWREVHGPWKDRRLDSEKVRDLLEERLAATGGFYSRVAEQLGIDRADYQRFIDFLKHSGLKVDHRPYRSVKRAR